MTLLACNVLLAPMVAIDALAWWGERGERFDSGRRASTCLTVRYRLLRVYLYGRERRVGAAANGQPGFGLAKASCSVIGCFAIGCLGRFPLRVNDRRPLGIG